MINNNISKNEEYSMSLPLLIFTIMLSIIIQMGAIIIIGENFAAYLQTIIPSLSLTRIYMILTIMLAFPSIVVSVLLTRGIKSILVKYGYYNDYIDDWEYNNT